VQVIGAAAAGFVALTVPLEARDVAPPLEAPMILIGWTALSLATLAADRQWHRTWSFTSSGRPLPFAGGVIGAAALVHLGLTYGLFALLTQTTPTGTPFTNEQSLMSFLVVVALIALAATRVESHERVGVLCVALLVAAALFRQQLPFDWSAVAWSAFAILALVGAPLSRPSADYGHATAAVLLGGAALATLFIVAPPSRLTVDPGAAGLGGGPPNGATIALAALALGMGVAAWREQRVLGTRWLGVGCLVAVVYALSVGLVDTFAVRVPRPDALEEVGKQAQVALTILWALIGLALLGYGLVRDSLAGRGAGLALLGLATAKAFIYDLAALDIAYRVLSLIGLGVLLLAGAYAYQRLRSHPGGGGTPLPVN
jgi:hypothetical protein